ncbi:MAG: GGDEF domain-containing protein [Spirochaetales bacterium]|nr:GGDEF domain-containing protein [Spirochaetales bacterium]
MTGRWIFKPFFISFTTLTLILFLVFNLLFNSNYSRKIEEIRINEEARVLSVKRNIEESLTQVYADLAFLNDVIVRHLEHSGPGTTTNLEENLVSFSIRKGIYDQIRYIDTEGNEIIRINKSGSSAVIVAPEQLQNKKIRYYFSSTMDLDKGMVYISPLDLNMENNAVEIPFKPMIRFAVPAIDSTDERRGIVILNYLAGTILERLSDMQSKTECCSNMLLNRDGFWLHSDHFSDFAFRFMFPEQEQIGIFDFFPDEAEMVYSKEEGVLTTGKGIFIWNSIYPGKVSEGFSASDDSRFVKEAEDSCWKNLSFINRGYLDTIRSETIKDVFSNFPIILIMNLVISLLIAYLFFRNRSQKVHMQHLATIDRLTGTMNRQFFLEMAAKSLGLVSRNSGMAAVLFMDLDGFKPVNDTYGHDAGDYVLKQVSSRMTGALRQSDLSARFGGDEFVALLLNLKTKDDIHLIISKIRSEMEAPIYFRNDNLSIGCSIGCAVFPEDGGTVEKLIERADGRMYEDKRKRKGYDWESGEDRQ